MTSLAQEAKRATTKKSSLKSSLKPGLKTRLLSSIQVASDEENFAQFTDDDFRASEFKTPESTHVGSGEKPKIFLNVKRGIPSDAAREKMVLGESLHNLKNVDPDRYRKLQQAALSSSEYRAWAHRSYKRSIDEYGEDRGFSEWHDQSRFDQVIGGFLFAGDEDLPTMKAWNRETLPFGEPFKKELLKLERDLNK